MKERVLAMLHRLIIRAQAEGSLRGDVVVTDLPIIFAIVGDLAGSGAGNRTEVYHRYLQLIAEHVPAIEGRRRLATFRREGRRHPKRPDRHGGGRR